MIEISERFEQDKFDSMMNHKILGFPVIKKILKLREIHSVEEHSGNDDLKSILDIFEGSDSIGLENNGFGVVGLSSRVQWAHSVDEYDPFKKDLPINDFWFPQQLAKFLRNKGYKTFTIRFKRPSGDIQEYQKRIYAILHNTSYPIYTVQQYVEDRKAYKGLGYLLSLGICRTKDLILYIKNGKERIHYTKGKVDDYGKADYYIVKWEQFINYYPIWFYPENFIKKSPQSNLFGFIKKR